MSRMRGEQSQGSPQGDVIVALQKSMQNVGDKFGAGGHVLSGLVTSAEIFNRPAPLTSRPSRTLLSRRAQWFKTTAQTREWISSQERKEQGGQDGMSAESA
jgi:hypothetical protein